MHGRCVRVVLALLLFVLAGHGSAASRTVTDALGRGVVGAEAPSLAGHGSAASRTVTDALGRGVVVAEAPSRIISVAPSVTEVLLALGLGPRVVGVSSADDYPKDELRDKPRVGGVVLDVERIVRLRPDLVLGMPSLQRGQLDRLIASGLPVVAVEARTLPEVYEQILFIGQLTGTERRADRLVTSLRIREATVDRTIGRRTRPRTYIEVWPEPLIAVGGGTFIDDLVSRARGRNIFADRRGFPQVSAESVLRANPEVVIVTHPQGRSVSARPGWQGIAAVKNSRVAQVDGSLLSRPGPRAVAGLELLARIIHLEAFR
jgi:iron complex transport system substrate-binding protein